METMNHIRTNLIEHHIKPSFQRIKIMQYLMLHKVHPTVDQIYSALVTEIPTLSKTTVYNTMNIFEQAQIVKNLAINSNEMRYDVDTRSHGHFVCENCGTIYDFDVNDIDFQEEGIEAFQIKERSVLLKGNCKNCLN